MIAVSGFCFRFSPPAVLGRRASEQEGECGVSKAGLVKIGEAALEILLRSPGALYAIVMQPSAVAYCPGNLSGNGTPDRLPRRSFAPFTHFHAILGSAPNPQKSVPDRSRQDEKSSLAPN
jgi:hypothetical protein